MNDLTKAMSDLFDCLSRLAEAEARGSLATLMALRTEVSGHVAEAASLAMRPVRVAIDGPPPRAVAVAMAQAVFSAPHLRTTLVSKTTMSDETAIQPSDPLADALGLPRWELDEIREDIDYRVAGLLKQTRAMHWLWTRHEHPGMRPEGLFRTLFPGVEEVPGTHFMAQGSRLYAVVGQEVPPPMESLYLRWLAGTKSWKRVPDSWFSARYVDLAIVRTMGRALGATPEEARGILDNMVCTVPSSDEEAFVRHDRWRHEGWADLTGLGVAGQGPEWVVQPLAPHALDDDGLLQRREAGVAVLSPRRVFDRHALGRIKAIAHGLYAEICARLLDNRVGDVQGQAVLFDLSPYIQRSLNPLLAWATSERTIEHLADRIDAEQADVAAALGKARSVWLEAAEGSWGGVPSPSRPHTVQTLLATHLAICQASLQRVSRLTPDPRAPHRRVLPLFFAHYMNAASLGRLWKVQDGRLPIPEDVVGDWFWGLWQRVLDADDESDG